MGVSISEPRIIMCNPFCVVGSFACYEGIDESPGWTGAYSAFIKRKHEISHRVDSNVLGFMYRPHRDHPEIPEGVTACFVGVNVADFNAVPAGMHTTRFPGGQYAVMNCIADSQDEASVSVGTMVDILASWINALGYTEGDACFASSDESESGPPYKEYVYMHLR